MTSPSRTATSSTRAAPPLPLRSRLLPALADQRAQHLGVDVVEAAQVDAALAALVLPELLEKLLPFGRAHEVVEDHVPFARREADAAHLALAAALVPVAVLAEA